MGLADLPASMMWTACCTYDDIREALDREKQLKGWRREKKIALIKSVNPQWLDLSRSCFEAMLPSRGRDASTPLFGRKAPEQLRSA